MGSSAVASAKMRAKKRGQAKSSAPASQMPALRRSNVFAGRDEVRILHTSKILDTTMVARAVLRPSSSKCPKVTKVEACEIVIVESIANDFLDSRMIETLLVHFQFFCFFTSLSLRAVYLPCVAYPGFVSTFYI